MRGPANPSRASERTASSTCGKGCAAQKARSAVCSAPGDDLATLARGGPAGTGAVGARYGVVATGAGLVFLAGGDGKVRAYDEDTGQVLWTGTLPGTASGIPVSYEAKGRQYFVIGSLPGGFRGGVNSQAYAPRGYIAFALPKR